MSITEIQISIDDFNGFDWQALLAQASKKTCEKYQQVLGAAIEETTSVNQKNALTLLSAVCSLWLNPESDDGPFVPRFVFSNSRGLIADDFTDQQIEILEQLASSIRDPELRARVADVSWIRRRDYRMAEMAITAYLHSVETLDQSEDNYLLLSRIERAVGLAASLSQGALFEQATNTVESLIQKRADQDDSGRISMELLQLLVKYRKGDFRKYSDICAKFARLTTQSQNSLMARAYWELQAQWESLAKNEDGLRDSRLQIAETYVDEAREAIETRNPPSYMVAAEILRHAIEALRRVSGTKPRQDELHKLLLEYQEKSLDEFGKISSDPIDLTESVRQAIAHVSGKSFNEAVFAIALIYRSPKASEIEESVKAMYQHSPLMAILASTRSDERGRYIKRRPGIVDNDPEEAKVALKIEMYSYAVQLRSLSVTGVIDPARRQITREHYLRLNDLLSFVSNNPFVPEGRELIFAQGFQKGFDGDFVVSSHLLIPQIENSLRYILNQRGIITSSLSSDGIQEDYDINRLLYMPELNDVFGEDILFDLKGLLTEASGSNLRNRMAHGLVSRNEFFSTEAIYMWWLTLRLCCLPILSAMGGSKNAPEEKDEQP